MYSRQVGHLISAIDVAVECIFLAHRSLVGRAERTASNGRGVHRGSCKGVLANGFNLLRLATPYCTQLLSVNCQ